MRAGEEVGKEREVEREMKVGRGRGVASRERGEVMRGIEGSRERKREAVYKRRNESGERKREMKVGRG